MWGRQNAGVRYARRKEMVGRMRTSETWNVWNPLKTTEQNKTTEYIPPRKEIYNAAPLMQLISFRIQNMEYI